MKRINLLEAMESVMIGVDKPDNLLLMDFIAFDGNWIRSFKDEIAVSFPLDSGVNAAVKANEFYKILSKMEGEDVTLSVTEEGKLEIKDFKTALFLNPLQEAQYQNVLARSSSLITDDLQYFFLPKEFKDALGLCTFGAGTDKSLNVLAGVHCNENIIISTDNYRVSLFTMEESIPAPFTIPTEIAQGFLKIPVELNVISVTNSWLHLSGEGGAVFSARLLSETYPIGKVKGVFESMKFGDESDFFTFPEGIDKSLERTEIMAGANDDYRFLSQITLSYSKGDLVITGSRDIGTIREKIPWKEKHIPEGMTLNIAPEYLRKILGFTKDFQLSPTKKSILFSSNKFKHLMTARTMY